jgi:tripartite-type tricarboxylate transporter receptor subunit TctC
MSSAAARVLVAAALSTVPVSAHAADFPRKPIRIVTADAGGGSDFVARLIGQGWTAMWGRQVVVDNRGGGTIAGEIVAHAAADGYTLLYYGSTFWLLPLMRKQMPYDAARDFAPVTLAVATPAVLVVHPAVAARSVRELIALAKARPGQLNYASAAAGTATHLAAELFKSMAGVDFVRVPYKGTGAALNDLLGGQTQLMFAVAASVVPHVKAGRLRALGVTGAQPSAALPDVPAIAAAGVPGYEAVQYSGLFAPARTPAAIVELLSRAAATVLNRSETRERLYNLGVEVVGSTPAEFAAKIKSEVGVLGKVIRDAGIQAD